MCSTTFSNLEQTDWRVCTTVDFMPTETALLFHKQNMINKKKQQHMWQQKRLCVKTVRDADSEIRPSVHGFL